MKEIKVSIIVPVYNAAPYLRQCLDSVVKQTLREVEIILVDDGSLDESGDICREYLSDERVVYYRKENEGLAAARQDGMERARGEYIGFVDSDDWLELDMFQRMYEEGQGADIVFCNVVENEDGHRMSPQLRSGMYNRREIQEEILPKCLAYINNDGDIRATRWSNCLRMYKRSMLEKHNIAFDRRFRRSQDLFLTYLATLAAESYCYMGEAYLYHNRVVPDSLSRGYTKNMWRYYKPLIERLYKETEDCKEVDLMPYMHLRAFDSVAAAIDNEFKPLCPNDKETRLAIIREIMEDELSQRFAGHIPLEKLSEHYREYYKYIQRQAPEALTKYNARCALRRKYIQIPWRCLKGSVLHFITEGPVIGRMYKKLRRKHG